MSTLNINLVKDPIVRDILRSLNDAIVAVPVGAIIEFANLTTKAMIDDEDSVWPIEGFLMCDGREVLRTQYSALFGVIGASYGDGDGSTTFNLPTKTMTTTLYGVKYK